MEDLFEGMVCHRPSAKAPRAGGSSMIRAMDDATKKAVIEGMRKLKEKGKPLFGPEQRLRPCHYCGAPCANCFCEKHLAEIMAVLRPCRRCKRLLVRAKFHVNSTMCMACVAKAAFVLPMGDGTAQ